MLEMNLLSFIDLIVDIYTVGEIVVTAVLRGDKAILFSLVEPEECPSQAFTVAFVTHVPIATIRQDEQSDTLRGFNIIK